MCVQVQEFGSWVHMCAGRGLCGTDMPMSTCQVGSRVLVPGDEARCARMQGRDLGW